MVAAYQKDQRPDPRVGTLGQSDLSEEENQGMQEGRAEDWIGITIKSAPPSLPNFSYVIFLLAGSPDLYLL